MKGTYWEKRGQSMIDRICISLNNRCNLNCKYCHFHEKGIIDDAPMDVLEILRHVKEYADHPFKIGFVGNGEPFLDFPMLKECLRFLEDSPLIQTYTITNGTIPLPEEGIRFLEHHRVNVGFSLDGYQELHDKNRCDSYQRAMSNVQKYREVTGHYPTFNATVGRESLLNCEKVISFFEPFGTRVTFSRMIGKYGITLEEYRAFLTEAENRLSVRRGGLDCTMYGGQCGAGTNNYFFANGKVYYCGNCIDLPPLASSSISFSDLEQISLIFDRRRCYKESL